MGTVVLKIVAIRLSEPTAGGEKSYKKLITTSHQAG